MHKFRTLSSDRISTNYDARKQLRIMVKRQISSLMKIKCNQYIKRQEWSNYKQQKQKRHLQNNVKKEILEYFRLFCKKLKPLYLYQLKTQPLYFIRNDPATYLTRQDLIRVIDQVSINLKQVNNNFYISFSLPKLESPLPRVANMINKSKLSMIEQSINNEVQQNDIRYISINPGKGVTPAHIRVKRKNRGKSNPLFDSSIQDLIQKDFIHYIHQQTINKKSKKKKTYSRRQKNLDTARQKLQDMKKLIQQNQKNKQIRINQRIKNRQQQISKNIKLKQQIINQRINSSIQIAAEKQQKMKQNIQIFKLTKRLQQTSILKPIKPSKSQQTYSHFKKI